MTLEKLVEILSLVSIGDLITELSKPSVTIPKWSDLEKQYDPMKHKIMTDIVTYPPKFNEYNADEFKRTPLALQKLAVSRIAQSMFSTPVLRSYNYDRDSESQQKAVDILEEVYRTLNFIDSENIERAKALNASCQMATVWFTMERPLVIEDETSNLKLAHKTYSELDGYELFPIMDEGGDLLVLSIGYKDNSDVEHFAVYINFPEKAEFRMYDKGEEWVLNTEVSNNALEVFPVVYHHIKEPVWGGEAGTNLVEQLEEIESYQGMYIKRNALPTFTLDYGEIEAGKQSTTEEQSDDTRRIITVGKGGKMTDVTWEGADSAVDAKYSRIRNSFFEAIQVPDTSFANMISSNTSAENKELVFADAKAKARDLGGEWEQLFLKELEIVKKFVSIMFSKIAKDIETISIRSSIQPYSIKTKKENAEYVTIAGNAMSLQTKVRVLGEVDDVQEEVDAINEEGSAEANQLSLP